MSKQSFVRSSPWPKTWRLAMIRLIVPCCGTPESSRTRSASLPKSTVAANGVTSPWVSWSDCWRSLHQGAFAAAAAAESAIVTPTADGSGSSTRGPTLTMATPFGVPPPGTVSEAPPGLGARKPPLSVSQSPTPILVRTSRRCGSQAACGMRTSTCRRSSSTATVGCGVTGCPVVASSSSTLSPCQVRNSCAGEETPAPCGQSRLSPPPRAIVNAVRAGSCSVLRVTRKAVASGSGRARSSTRSAALWA